MKTDVYQTVTDKIIASLEQGVRPWSKPWSAADTGAGFVLPLRGNGVPYRGINILMLWGASFDNNYRLPVWLTYKQTQEKGGQVRKGEKGSTVVFASSMTRTETGDGGEENERSIPFLKGYTVFNVAQIDGIEGLYPQPVAGTRSARIRADRAARISLFRRLEQPSGTAATAPSTNRRPTPCKCRPPRPSAIPSPITAPSFTS